ncbi:MAG: YqeG family HAD IIIA-type phosphatase [Oscillospiraceae bacterium]|nr:YqeG family HAD IIIA-type phosphatase [Oscillospiraceae bacterium]
MALFFPTTSVPKAYDITLPMLGAMGVQGLILDIDNTLTTHDHPTPDERILTWLDQMQAAGIRLILLSNNRPSRVEPFAKKLGLAFEADGKKPLPGGYRRAAAAMGLDLRRTAAVGDQIFTDILGANLAGMPSILVEPFQIEPFFRFRLKRFLEKKILCSYRKKKGREKA